MSLVLRAVLAVSCTSTKIFFDFHVGVALRGKFRWWRLLLYLVDHTLSQS
jgi:hypothetical protein